MTVPGQNAPIAPEEMQRAQQILSTLSTSFSTKVVGQRHLQQALVVTLLSNAHILLESVPGLAKTLSASTLASAVKASFARVQCTPDLLPSDIIGTQVFDAQNSSFLTQLGPVHANFVLLDEINRSSAKTQSAMLEAMQERQTTIGGETHKLPSPFMVLATQNPIEEEGTYVLPQAQMDRFLLKEVVDYPSPAEEVEMLERIDSGALDSREVEASLAIDDVLFLQGLTKRIYVDPAIKRYVVTIINATRNPAQFIGPERAGYIEYGASPRGSIAFLQVARAIALLNGRNYVVPEDVKALRHSVLRHRLILTFEAVAQRVPVEQIIDALVNSVQTP